MSRKKNPLDEALHSKVKTAVDRTEQDIQVWKAWKDNPTPSTTDALLHRFEPVFQAKIQQYRAPNVNPSAFKAHMKEQALKAFDTFDPERASPRTHLNYFLRRSHRFNAQHQNMAAIPEGRAMYIGPIDRAKAELEETQGRPPTPQEISGFLNQNPDFMGGKKKVTPQFVAKIEQGRRADVLSSQFESDPAPFAASRDDAVWGLLRTALTPQEQQVYDKLNGAGSTIGTGELAKTLNMSPSQVSRLKNSIIDKYKKYR